MEYQLGDIIKEKRIEHGYTQQELADLSGYTRALISKVEQSKRNPSEDLLLELSYILSFDFVSVYKNLGKYKSFAHFTLYNELLKSVEVRDIIKINELVNNKVIKDEFTYGETYIFREYCKTLVYLDIDNDVKRAHKLCLKALNIDESSLDTLRIKLNQSFHYYSLFMCYGRILYLNKQINEEKILLEKIVKFLEKNYFNSIIPSMAIDQFYKKYYIIALNNIADVTMRLGNYTDSITICDKAIEKSKELNVLNIIYDVLMLKCENLFMLNKVEEARTSYTQLANFCILTNHTKFLEHETERLKVSYPNFLV